MSTTATDKRTEMIQGLRELADFIEQNPHVPIPTWACASRMFLGQYAEGEFRAAHYAVKPTLVEDDNTVWGDVVVRRRFSGGVNYSMRIARKNLIPDTHIAPHLPDWLKAYEGGEQ